MSLAEALCYRLPDLEYVPLEAEKQTQVINNLVPSPKSNAIISSFLWTGGRFRRARICNLLVPGKFFAETLVIYPQYEYDFPIFGAEYLCINQTKFFGAVDFHPISDRSNYALEYLGDFPDRDKNFSKFYDFSEYFSDKMWLRKSESSLYDEFLSITDSYLKRYAICAQQCQAITDTKSAQIRYDTHMAKNDPAHGILKAYFSEDFANHYIKNFLFDLSCNEISS